MHIIIPHELDFQRYCKQCNNWTVIVTVNIPSWQRTSHSRRSLQCVITEIWTNANVSVANGRRPVRFELTVYIVDAYWRGFRTKFRRQWCFGSLSAILERTGRSNVFRSKGMGLSLLLCDPSLPGRPNPCTYLNFESREVEKACVSGEREEYWRKRARKAVVPIYRGSKKDGVVAGERNTPNKDRMKW